MTEHIPVMRLHLSNMEYAVKRQNYKAETKRRMRKEIVVLKNWLSLHDIPAEKEYNFFEQDLRLKEIKQFIYG